MANEILTLKIDVDSATGVAKLRQFDSEVGKVAGKSQSAFQQLGLDTSDFTEKLEDLTPAVSRSAASVETMATAFGIAAAAVALLGAGIRYTIIESIKAQESQQNLKNKVEVSGASWDSYSQSIDRAIQSVQRHSRYSSEDARQSLELMADATGDWGKAIASLPVVMDLAASHGTTMARAADAVSSAAHGQSSALNDYGIYLSKAEKQQIASSDAVRAFGAVLDIAGEKTRGFAQRDLETLSGSLADVKDSAYDTAVSIGGDFLEAMKALGTVASSDPLMDLLYGPSHAPRAQRSLPPLVIPKDPAISEAQRLKEAQEAAAKAGIHLTSTSEDLRAKQSALGVAFSAHTVSAAAYHEQLEAIDKALAQIEITSGRALAKAQGLVPTGPLSGFAGSGATPLAPPLGQFVGPVGPPGTDVHEQMALYGIDLETITEKQDRMAGGQNLLKELYDSGRISLDSYREGLAQLGVETDTYNEKLLFSQQTITNLQAAETALGLAQQFIASEGTKARQKHAKANAAIIIAEASLKAAFEIAEAAGAAASGNYAGAALHAVSAALYLAVGRNQAAAALKTGGTSASTAGSDRPQRGGAAPGSRTFTTSGGGNTIRQSVTINALDGNSVRDVVRSKGYQRQHARMMREAARRS